VDQDFSLLFLKNSLTVKPDTEAHRNEHAIEVQLPFLQVLNPAIRIVPIEMKDYRYETCLDVGSAIAKSLEKELGAHPNKRFAVIASSDMTHCGFRYGQPAGEGLYPGQFARKQDELAIREILDMNPENLLKVVEEKKITMCGPGPAAAVMVAAKAVGAATSRLLGYKTSADVTGADSDTAVGYAGILITP
jgi:AmmeMemoRadiSam system protein B